MRLKPATNCVVICGPTASGKTSLGVKLASCFGGEILSADSRQAYRGMDIGTGKDLADYQNSGRPVPYHLIDVADPSDIYSLWNFQQDFYAAFGEIHARDKLPVVVGGTGLYIEAVLKNYKIPDVPENVRLRVELMQLTLEQLLTRLESVDLEIREQTDTSSKKRIVRSLEVAHYARDHELRWGMPDPPVITPLVVSIRIPRPELKARIRRRLEARLEQGMIDEVESLITAGITRERLNLFGMEYGQIARYLAGEVSRENMIEDLFLAICKLAKRQATWFRGMERRGQPVTWIDGPDFNRAVKAVRQEPGIRSF